MQVSDLDAALDEVRAEARGGAGRRARSWRRLRALMWRG